MRKNEGNEVMEKYGEHFDMNIVRVDAKEISHKAKRGHRSGDEEKDHRRRVHPCL